MNSSKRKILIFAMILIAGLIFLQFKVKIEIISAINERLPSNIELEYTQINTNIFSGNASIDSLSAIILNTDKTILTSLNAESLKISGFSLWQYVFNKTISIEEIIFDNPNLQHYQNYQEKDSSINPISDKPFDKNIRVHKFSIVNGSLRVNANHKDSLITSMDSISVNIIGISTGAYKLKEKIPFNYKDYNFNSKHIYMNISQYEDLKIDAVNVNNGKLELENLYINSKFTKQELSNKIKVERDFIQLHIPELSLNSSYFGYNNSRFYLIASQSKINKSKLTVYRDKRIADDLGVKNMYSKMLRELPFTVNISEININHGYINYSERVENTSEAGEIFFENVNATITKFSNVYKQGEKTQILANSDFMGKAPMDLDISFDVNDKDDAFLASGQFNDFNTEITNIFFKSNLNAKVEGKIEELYFNFNGNKYSSKGDFKMKYKEFKFEIISENHGVNKLLTSIGNFLVNDGSKTDNKGYRYGKIEVERNKTKSFFNYLWLNVQDGVISTLTGSGEKK